MILIYLLLCILVGYTYKKSNLSFSFVLGILSLSLLLNEMNIFKVVDEMFSTITTILNNKFYILFFLLILIIFVIFDLFSLYNYNYPLEEKLENQKIKNKRIILTLVSFFSTNIDFTNSRLDIDGKTNFKLNSILLPLVNISSIPFIYLFMLFSFLLVKSIPDSFIVIGMLLNVFIIFWLIFSLLILFTKYTFHFSINNSIYNDIITTVDVKELNSYPIKPENKHRKLFIAAFIITTIATFLFITSFSIILLLDIALVFILFYMIYQGEVLSYKHSFIKENDIFITIFNSSKAFIYEIIEIILSIMLAINIYNFLNALNIKLSITSTFLIIITLMLFLFILFNNYKLVATTTIPVLALFINNFNHISQNTTLIILSISSYVTLLALFQFLSIININNLSRLQINLSFSLIIISLMYVLLIFTSSITLYPLFIIIVIMSILLAYIVLKGRKH